MKDADRIIAQLDELIKQGEQLTCIDPDTFEAEHNYSHAQTVITRMEAAIQRISAPDSAYWMQVERARARVMRGRLDSTSSAVKALRDDIQAGWLSSVVELVHAETYSDYLEMSEDLLGAGYKDPAAVIAGTSLEVHVRALCAKHGIAIEHPNGSPKKADAMNADLKKSGVYDGLQQKQVTAWLDLRNKAAHGDYGTYDDPLVRLFIEGLRAFILRYPA
ncbi:hypothetical protein [Streptomyces katrae]|uniref:hypothetical protein n=1 Tax=Streptomyces katrae TaxID=68223 RepID=UPI001900F1D9|nr:hypothetical protein [Streptomyces katrae]